MLIIHKSDTTVATAEQIALAAEYARIKKMQDLLDQQLTAAREALVESLGRGVTKVVDADGALLVSYVPTASSGKFDRKAFQAAHPRIHDRFWTPGVAGAGTARLTVNH